MEVIMSTTLPSAPDPNAAAAAGSTAPQPQAAPEGSMAGARTATPLSPSPTPTTTAARTSTVASSITGSDGTSAQLQPSHRTSRLRAANRIETTPNTRRVTINDQNTVVMIDNRESQQAAESQFKTSVDAMVRQFRGRTNPPANNLLLNPNELRNCSAEQITDYITDLYTRMVPVQTKSNMERLNRGGTLSDAQAAALETDAARIVKKTIEYFSEKLLPPDVHAQVAAVLTRLQ